MKNLNKNQWIAVSLSLIFLSYILFAGSIVNFLGSLGSSGAPGSPAMLAVEEMTVGVGTIAVPGDTLTVHYVGMLNNGVVFDSSLDRKTPLTFVLGAGQVIRGWEEGLIGMRVGGKRLLTIPPEYGYGEGGAGAIPPNSTLIFEVELLDVKKP